MAAALRALSAVGSAVLLLGLGATPATAHAIDETYQLPVPLWLYLWGAFAAVAASFVVVLAADRAAVVGAVASKGRPFQVPLQAVVVALLRGIGLLVWFGAMLTGLLGIVHEFLPATLFWTFLWAGLPIVAALVGNPWPVLSPFRTLYGLVARITGRDLDLGVPYPRWARRWPAVAFLAIGLIVELTVAGAELGASVGLVLLAYTVMTLAGMAVFGPVDWLRNAEAFEVLLGWFGRLAPIGRASVSAELCAGCREGCDPDRCVDCAECSIVASGGQLTTVLRPPLSAMSDVPRAGWSDAAFIVLALAGITFDGLQETQAWVAIGRVVEDGLTPLGASPAAGLAGPVGLVGTWLVFLAVFGIAAALVRRAGGISADVHATVGGWSATLLPIAAGYAIAHYGTLLLQGALSLPGMLASANAVHASLDWLPAGFVWYLSVIAIVVGHIAAVLLAHREAGRLDARRPLRAELPLVAIMLGYTVLSLWIIAEPITVEPR